MIPGNTISISILKQQKEAKLFIVYSSLLTYYKTNEVFIAVDKPSRKAIPVSVMSRYSTDFKSKSSLFIEHTSELATGKKLIRSGYLIFLGAELYAVDESGKVYKHSERGGMIDITIPGGLRIGKISPYSLRNRRLFYI